MAYFVKIMGIRYRMGFTWQLILSAFALMLLLEGVIPFLYPNKWRNLVATLAQTSDAHLRIMGLVSMLLGVALLYLVR